jgi:hypothetical protein
MAYAAITPYADVTYGDAYFAERLGAEAWDDADAADKLKALKQATAQIDLLPLVGEKCDTTTPQAREFPRDLDAGCADGSGDVPDEVARATCEVAIALLEGKSLRSLSEGANVKSERVGDASVQYGSARGEMGLYDDNYGLPSTEAANLLAPWLADTDVIDITRV